MPERLWETDFTETYHTSTYPSISPTRPELSAAGKTIFISGGGRGLGIGIVEAFATAGAAHIIILGRSTAALETVAAKTEAAHPSTKISTVSGDTSREEDVARAFAEAKKVSPEGVDVVVANAGYLPTVEPIPAGEGKGATEDWWKAWEVNVKGLYLLARQYLATAKPGASFVNISAAGGHINPALPGFSAYASSKLGAARFVETLQLENPGLKFYNVHPGVVGTNMLTKSGLESTGVPIDEPDLAGHFVTWLVSPEGEFLKGKYLWGNWDVDELKARKEELSAPRKLVTGLVGWA
ncbi:Short chain dehydrogenase andI [Diaporthe amygdali]|uniref:Short chain dehydrogenase andI n=1 Tax=Phomopsis amygdali TaxID=1214568 RepID=UPI0022FEAF47|nr:Short chain dehydrogenase andI [Diaporthe amygdali]KAJ0123730.1 Short chain dehydrogenase andI [Diaporthe amygdali]